MTVGVGATAAVALMAIAVATAMPLRRASETCPSSPCRFGLAGAAQRYNLCCPAEVEPPFRAVSRVISAGLLRSVAGASVIFRSV